MIRSEANHKEAESLYEILKEDEGIPQNKLQTAILSIMRIEAKSKYSKLHDQFQTFYLNRMTYIIPAKEKQEFSYTPRLGANTIRLAEKSRERCKKSVREAKGGLEKKTAIEDFLIMTKKAQDKKNMEKRHIKEIEEAKNCTFHPSISTSRTYSKDKCLSLFELSKSTKKLPGKTTEEIEYDKSKEELVFAPTISRYI